MIRRCVVRPELILLLMLRIIVLESNPLRTAIDPGCCMLDPGHEPRPTTALTARNRSGGN